MGSRKTESCQQDEILAAAKSGDAKAQEEVLNEYIGIVRYLAGRYKNKEDLISAGQEGILRAVSDFKSSHSKFSTYAYFWIKSLIRRELGSDNLIHIPEYFRQKASTKIQKRRQEKYIPYVLSAKNIISLDEPLGEDGDTLESFIGTEEKEFDKIELRCSLGSIIEKSLNKNERKLLKLRYGFGNGGIHHTLRDVGNAMGISRERARQLEKKVVEKIRAYIALAARQLSARGIAFAEQDIL